MKSRRLMYPQIEGLNLPYRRGAETALCNTAKSGVGHLSSREEARIAPLLKQAERAYAAFVKVKRFWE
jgi:hypothetical protein